MSVYRDNAVSYLEAGWTGVLPVPADIKFPPPKGYSGNDGADTDLAAVEAFRNTHPDYAILLRMPVDVVGLDVDHYNKLKTRKDGTTTIVKKRGADDLVKYEKLWGPLPATWRSSARELPSGIRYFRVPVGLKFCSGLGDIDTIQRTHRYSVAPPSVHEDPSLGEYLWTRPDGTKAEPGEVPAVSELPMLPDRWVTGMTEHVNQSRTAPSSSTEATSMLTAIETDTRPMCSLMDIACNRAVAQLNASSSGSRHDTATARTMRIVGLAAEGHAGGGAALKRTREAWDVITDGERREYEWDSLVSGAAAMAAGTVGAPNPRAIDPCEGGSGLGIVVITDPGEGKRITTAIVEGLESADVVAEYAAPDVTVIGIEGRESWRKDGIPVPELKIVAGTSVVIISGPDVASDLAAYTSAMDQARACVGKGAKNVACSQPPGTAGVTVAAWLNSLTEVERPSAVAGMLATVTDKPWPNKPDRGRRTLGADLELTDDSTLATGWAHSHKDKFRVISTDKSWMSYNDGRWSVDGAELAVSNSLMEFQDVVSEPAMAAMEKAKGSDPEGYEQLRRACDALRSARKRQALQSTAMSYGEVHVRRDQLDQHPRKFCVANGVLNLDTLEVGPHKPGLLLTTGSDVEYDARESCPEFDKFLREALPDEGVRSFVMRVFAMAMLGEVIDHVVPVFIGEGRNGKGVLLKVMLAVFGSHARSINAKALLKRKFDAHEAEIAQLAGKRLAVAEETGQKAEWDVARVNEWTGGGRLSGRFMGGNHFDFEPSHTLIMVTNHRPSVGQGEKAFWDRYKEVPFTVSFAANPDTGLAKRIIDNELSGVLNRLIVAGRSYMANGLQEPAAVTMATLDAKVEADSLARFCSDHLDSTDNHDGDRIVNSELYEAMLKWWSTNATSGETPPSDRAFPKLVGGVLGIPASANNPRKLSVVIKGKRSSVKVWTGVRWRSEASDDQDHVADVWSDGTGAGVEADVATPPVANGSVADVHDHVADVLPMSDDPDNSKLAGRDVVVADVADVADKVVQSLLYEESTKGTPVDHVNGSVDHVSTLSLPGSAVRIENIGNIGTSATSAMPPIAPLGGDGASSASGFTLADLDTCPWLRDADVTIKCPHCTRNLPSRVVELHIPKCSINPNRKVS